MQTINTETSKDSRDTIINADDAELNEAIREAEIAGKKALKSANELSELLFGKGIDTNYAFTKI